VAAAVTTTAAEEALKASITAKVDALAMSDDYLKSRRTNANELRSCIAKIKTVREDIEKEFSSRNHNSFSRENEK